jgi:protein TonB
MTAQKTKLVLLSSLLLALASASPLLRAEDPAPEIYNINQLDHAPQTVSQARPQYPFEMRSQGIEGEVTVGFVVDTDGNVQNVCPVKSSRAEFESAATAAVSQWKFHPGMKDGRAVNTRMQVPIVFAISKH